MSSPRRSTKAWWGSGAVLGLSLTVAACSTVGEAADPVPPPSAETTREATTTVVPSLAEQLHGVWANDGTNGGNWSSVLVRFDDVGGFAIGNTGRVDTGAYHVGTYEVAEDLVAFAAVDRRDCMGGEWWWKVEIESDGVMRSEVTNGRSCDPIGRVDGWIRVSPASSAGRALAAGTKDAQRRTPRERVDVFGVWLRVGTGEILQFQLDGTFAIDDTGDLHANPALAGTFTLDNGSIRFETERTGDGVCSPGATWAWSDVTVADDLVIPNLPRGTTMRAEGPGGHCAAADSESLVWRLLSGGGR